MAAESSFHPGRTGWLIVISSIIFFKILNRFCNKLIPVPAGVFRGHGDEFRVFRWRNLVISFTHATIVGCWAFVCVVLYGKEMREDMITFGNWLSYTLCCFTSGYFLYDAMDIIAAKRVLEKWEILVHHGAILISAYYVVATGQCVGYQTVGMLVEVNTIFLHRRQLYLLAGIERSESSYRTNTYANMFTFVVFRCSPLAYLIYGVCFDGGRVPFWYLCFYGSCLVVLVIVNIVLLYRLLRADFSLLLEIKSQNSNGHQKSGSNVGCCDGAMMSNVTKCVMEGSHIRQNDGLHLRSNVMKHVTKLNDNVRRTLSLTP